MRILEAAARLREQFPIAGVAGEEQCCVYARLVLAEVYGAAQVDRQPLARWHLWDVADPWSPVAAAAAAGLASAWSTPPAQIELVVGRWHLCQGWRGTPGAAGVTGHTWLWLALTAATGLRIDSAAPAFRPAPGPEARLTRWAELVAPYRGGVAVAVLHRPREVP
jgi:hypothetical protein